MLHAIGAAIPQALVLLHALLEVLPYPRHPRGVWYEIFTGRVACTDEEQAEADAEADTAEAGKEGAKVKSWLKNIGSVEASETILKERIAVRQAKDSADDSRVYRSTFTSDLNPKPSFKHLKPSRSL